MAPTGHLKAGLLRRAAIGALAAAAGFTAAPALAADADATVTAAADGAAQVGEGIVTATRREEKLSKVPVAVTAITGEQARSEHINNFADIPAMVPGATFIATKGQSTANLQLRGQTTTNDSPHLEIPI